MSEYYLEMFTSDNKFIIKDGDGNVVSDEPLPRKDAIAALEALQKPKVQKVKKAKKAKKEEEIKDDERKDEDGTLDD